MAEEKKENVDDDISYEMEIAAYHVAILAVCGGDLLDGKSLEIFDQLCAPLELAAAVNQLEGHGHPDFFIDETVLAHGLILFQKKLSRTNYFWWFIERSKGNATVSAFCDIKTIERGIKVHVRKN